MDRTKTKLATFFNSDDDEDASFPQKSVDESKISQYTHGIVKKSKREKEKEREEAKRREQEELAAKTYAEFLDAFEGEGAKRKSTFVKAGGSAADDVKAYKPKLRGGRDEEERGFDREVQREPTPPPAAPKPKGKRAMDAFLEEIKREQAEREQRLSQSSQVQGRSVTALAAYEGQSGSRDRGDPLTTNVYVANLPSQVSEAILGNFFAAKCGPVGSVKIMWPRGDISQGPGADITSSRGRKNAGLSGFVSFMKRKDAETAVRDLDGYEWNGTILRVGWSKAVPIAAKPAYVAERHSRSKSRSRSRSRDRHQSHRRSRSYSKDRRHHSRSYSRSRSRSHSRHHSRRAYSYSRSRSRSRSRHGGTSHGGGRKHYRSRSRSRSYDRSRRYSRSRTRSPKRRRSDSPFEKERTGVDPETEKFIRTVALKVKDNGESFEDVLRERERENPKFKFLFDTATPEHRLYRAIINGESLVLGFDDEGYNSVYSTDSAEESERERVRKHKLGKLARKRFEAMLRAMSGRRGEIARCMAFSLEHAEAASEVTDIIVASLLVDSTPVPRKVARLQLICDILHNSAASVPSAWKYRQEFQSRLGIVFDHLSSIYHSFPGRITAETFKKQIMAVVTVWEDWIVFSPDFIETLKSRLDGTTETKKDTGKKVGEKAGNKGSSSTTSKFKSSSFKPAMVEPGPKASISQPDEAGEADMDMDDSDKEVAEEDDIDGVPIDDIDGEPIDGEPMEDDDDIDGVPINLDDLLGS